MTAPLEPAPGAPVVAPSPETPPVGSVPATPPSEDVTALPDWAQKALRDARADAAKSRTTAKQTAAEEARKEMAAQVAKALGIAGDEPVKPEELTAQVEAAQSTAWRNGTELALYRVATRLGADAEALLDSNSFLDTLDDLVSVDPRSAEFATQLEAKVNAALEKSPAKFKTAGQASGLNAPRPDPSQGPRGNAPAPFAGVSLTDAVKAHYAGQH